MTSLIKKKQAKLSGASLVAKSFNIPLKSLKRWLRNGAERKKGK